MSLPKFLFGRVLLLSLSCLATISAAEEAPKIRVLFVFGGHSFDEPQMYEMLDSFSDVVYEKAEMPQALDLLALGLEKKYDCLVMYDFYTFPYSKEQTDRFKALLEQGIGLVVLHHSTGGYKDWDDYPRLIGGKFITEKEGATIDGKAYPPSTWDHDQTMKTTVVDREHPIMNGIDDFTIIDEAYGGVYVDPKTHVLLTTDNPKSTRQIAWTWRYGKSPVFVSLLGHDAKAYENPNFSRMVHQAIRWAARKKPAAAKKSEVLTFKNIPYVPGGNERRQLDIYLPWDYETLEKPLPLVIAVHGGGWAAGRKEDCKLLADWLLPQGYAVAAINYRFTDTDAFPAQIEDCKAAVRWLRANAEKYKFDKNRFGTWGASAGGHLVALLGCTGGTKEFDVGENLDQSSAVQAVCDYFGPTDFSVLFETPGFKDEHHVDTLVEKLLGGMPKDKPEAARKASPINYADKNSAPMLIVQGDKDLLVPYQQSEIFEKKLKEAGVPCELIMLQGAGHGGNEFLSPELLKRIEAFYAKFLKK